MRFAAVALILVLAACQSAQLGGIEGNWASDDGVFVAAFDNGAFTSRLTGTGETVVADGRYSRTGSGLSLAWTSITTNERRTADCTFLSSSQVRCTPSVGNPFTMTRATA
ncbi:MAG: hypothetical protein AAGF45_11975 [Pseudomonadota bacterium]